MKLTPPAKSVAPDRVLPSVDGSSSEWAPLPTCMPFRRHAPITAPQRSNHLGRARYAPEFLRVRPSPPQLPGSGPVAEHSRLHQGWVSSGRMARNECLCQGLARVRTLAAQDLLRGIAFPTHEFRTEVRPACPVFQANLSPGSPPEPRQRTGREAPAVSHWDDHHQVSVAVEELRTVG